MQLKYNWENLFSLGFTTEEMYRAETEAKASDLAYVSSSSDAQAIIKVLLHYFPKENILHFFCVAPYVFRTAYDLIMKRIKQLDDLGGKDWPNIALSQLQSQEDFDLLYLLSASEDIWRQCRSDWRKIVGTISVECHNNKFLFDVYLNGTAALKCAQIADELCYIPPIVSATNGREYIVTAISDLAFLNQEKMKRLVIPNGVKELGHAAFDGCNSLVTVVLPATIEYLDGPFCKCTPFEHNEGGKILYLGLKDQWKNVERSMFSLDHTPYNEIIQCLGPDADLSIYGS